MSQGLRLSHEIAVKIGWTLITGPVFTAVYALTWGGSGLALWILATILTCAALFFLAAGYSWVLIGSGVRVEPNENVRIAVIEERASRDDVRFIDILVTQCVSVRWFVKKMAERGKDVRLLIYDPELTSDSSQRTKCIQSLHDVITSLNPTTLQRLKVHAYNLIPSVRALVLRDANETPLFASLGWYSHLGNGVGGSRYPAVIFGNKGQAEKLLLKFVDDEVNKKRSTGRTLTPEEIIQLFNSSTASKKKVNRKSAAKGKADKDTTKDSEQCAEPL